MSRATIFLCNFVNILLNNSSRKFDSSLHLRNTVCKNILQKKQMINKNKFPPVSVVGIEEFVFSNAEPKILIYNFLFFSVHKHVFLKLSNLKNYSVCM